MLSKFVINCVAVLTAIIATQAPQFILQYQFHLQGHLAESKYVVATIERAAHAAHKTLPEYIDTFSHEQNKDMQKHGQFLTGLLKRYSDLQLATESLQDAPIWRRPLIVLQYAEIDIMEETAYNFTPALALTLETLVYALIGFLLGAWCSQAVGELFSRFLLGKEPVQK